MRYVWEEVGEGHGKMGVFGLGSVRPRWACGGAGDTSKFKGFRLDTKHTFTGRGKRRDHTNLIFLKKKGEEMQTMRSWR